MVVASLPESHDFHKVSVVLAPAESANNVRMLENTLNILSRSHVTNVLSVE